MIKLFSLIFYISFRMMEPFRFASATIQNLGSETLIYKNSFLHLCRSLVSENCCRNLNQQAPTRIV